MSNENRNCSSCNNMMKQNVTDNCQDVNQLTALNNPIGFNTNCSNVSPCQENTKSQMLNEIKCLAFAIQELALYLDTHPDDEKALCLHNKYCKEYRDLTDKYQKVYGPLTINYPCNKWRWLESPWPWEGGIF